MISLTPIGDSIGRPFDPANGLPLPTIAPEATAKPKATVRRKRPVKATQS